MYAYSTFLHLLTDHSVLRDATGAVRYVYLTYVGVSSFKTRTLVRHTDDADHRVFPSPVSVTSAGDVHERRELTCLGHLKSCSKGYTCCNHGDRCAAGYEGTSVCCSTYTCAVMHGDKNCCQGTYCKPKKQPNGKPSRFGSCTPKK